MAQRPTKRETPPDAHTLALSALVWVLSEPSRADRLLALTGLSAAELRARADEPAVLAAVLGFLESHEPDLTACAAALDVTPAAITSARHALEVDGLQEELGNFA